MQFMANFLVGKLDECAQVLVGADRVPEAAFFARTYLPSKVRQGGVMCRGWACELLVQGVVRLKG